MEYKHNTFGAWWEALLKEKGYTINKLSTTIGTKPPQLYGIRDNKKPLSVKLAFKIEMLTNISAIEQLYKQVEFKLDELKTLHKKKPLFNNAYKRKK